MTHFHSFYSLISIEAIIIRRSKLRSDISVSVITWLIWLQKIWKHVWSEIFFTPFVYGLNWRLHAIFQPSISIFKTKVTEKKRKNDENTECSQEIRLLTQLLSKCWYDFHINIMKIFWNFFKKQRGSCFWPFLKNLFFFDTLYNFILLKIQITIVTKNIKRQLS